MSIVEESRLDPAVVAALYIDHAEQLRRFLLGILRDPSLANDVLQATFTKAVQVGHTTCAKSRKAWLFRVAYNEAAALCRRRTIASRATRRLAWSRPAIEDPADQPLIRLETVEAVRTALAELPAKQRQVVRMRIYEEKTFAVIAEELGIPLGTALAQMRSTKETGKKLTVTRPPLKQGIGIVMRHEEPDDLDWLAFCYIADELSLDEAAAFENRLADDQTAREAVARAVELTRAVVVVGAEDLDRATPASVVRGAWRRRSLAGRVGWTAITATACLVVLVLAYRHDRGIGPVASSPQEAPGGGHVGASDSVPDELAIVWSQTREELAAVEFDVWAADSPDNRDESEDWSPLPAEDDAEEDLYAANTPPSWMLAAVRAMDLDPVAEDHSGSSSQEN